MKQLSAQTIKRYNVRQLAKHLDRYLDSIGSIDYIVDLACGRILELDRDQDAYVFYCSIIDQNKDIVQETLEGIYYLQNNHQNS